ncbi:hypothetical protein [Haloarcula laminariae]|uniref:hypothetical protein n=1 Tax=Haloarcula laminariae TaxID=2961577 RepID=UPI002404B98B|nr:hypothetical protein [Halomicroarcula sp. FL173]
MKHRFTAVASRALELALRGQQFQVTDIQRGLSDPPSRQTIYRVLDQLAEDDWLRCSGKIWHPDIKADMLGDLDDEEDSRDGFSLSADDVL